MEGTGKGKMQIVGQGREDEIQKGLSFKEKREKKIVLP